MLGYDSVWEIQDLPVQIAKVVDLQDVILRILYDVHYESLNYYFALGQECIHDQRGCFRLQLLLLCWKGLKSLALSRGLLVNDVGEQAYDLLREEKGEKVLSHLFVVLLVALTLLLGLLFVELHQVAVDLRVLDLCREPY